MPEGKHRRNRHHEFAEMCRRNNIARKWLAVCSNRLFMFRERRRSGSRPSTERLAADHQEPSHPLRYSKKSAESTTEKLVSRMCGWMNSASILTCGCRKRTAHSHASSKKTVEVGIPRRHARALSRPPRTPRAVHRVRSTKCPASPSWTSLHSARTLSIAARRHAGVSEHCRSGSATSCASTLRSRPMMSTER